MTAGAPRAFHTLITPRSANQSAANVIGMSIMKGSMIIGIFTKLPVQIRAFSV
jgi:hypothetical protein